MLLDQDIRSEAKAVWLINYLRIFRFPERAIAMQRALVEEVGPLAGFNFYPATAEHPSYSVGYNANFVLFAADGATSLPLGAGLWNGYDAASLGPLNLEIAVNDPKNPFIEEAARQCGFSTFRPKMIFCGFSLGGAIAQVLAGRMMPSSSGLAWEICTFGSPRPAGRSLQAATQTARKARWMNDDDWVPLLPPHIQEGILGAFSASNRQARTKNNFVHTAGGLMLGNTGGINAVELPNIATIPSATNLAASFFGADTGGWFPHSLDEYRRRLLFAIARQPQGELMPHRGANRERPDPITQVAIRRAEQRAEAVIFNLGVVQNEVQEIIPPDRLFKAKRIGRTWWVYFGNKAICIAPIRRRAQGIAAAGNDFIRRLQRQAFVDPATFADQMTEYLKAASDPGSGFQPQLQVTMPAF